MGGFIFLGIVLLVSLPSFAKATGVWGICLIVCVVSFGMMASRGMNTPKGRGQTRRYNERERKIEEEYGIIDFTEKDK